MAAIDGPHVVETEGGGMTFSERTAHEIRRAIGDTPGFSERPMYSGIAFMVQGNMCCGVLDDNLVVRVGPDTYDDALREPHTRPMDFTGRALPGFVYVDRPGFESAASLGQWIERSLRFARTLPPKS
jgi:hypothetical protein